jgi:hypothetical protein
VIASVSGLRTPDGAERVEPVAAAEDQNVLKAAVAGKASKNDRKGIRRHDSSSDGSSGSLCSVRRSRTGRRTWRRPYGRT